MLLATSLALFVGSAQLNALEAQPRITSALEKCLNLRAQRNEFSGVISVADHEHQLLSIVRGNVASADGSQIGNRTRFNLASMSKMFTAVAIAQLVDAGKVKLDGPIGQYVQGLTPEASAVTVRQLLTHSAGLGNFFRPENMGAMLKARSATDLFPLLVSEKPTFLPGSHFEYSNSGFAILGIIIEQVSGISYGEYLSRNVFSPAGMTDTGLNPNPINTLAVGMTAGPGAFKQSGVGGAGNGLVVIGPDGKPSTPGGAPLANAAPVLGGSSGTSLSPSSKLPLRPAPGATDGYGSSAGGIFSTAEDLQHFAVALLSNKLASAATTAAFTSKQFVASAATQDHPERDYGFGFGVGDKDGHRWFGHNGGTLGANTEFAVFPDDRLVLIVLSNRDPPSASELFSYTRDLVLHPDLQATCGSTLGGIAYRAAPAAQPEQLAMRGPPPPDRIQGSVAKLPMNLSTGIPSIEIMIAGKGPFIVGLDTGAPPGLHFRPDIAGAIAGSSVGELIAGVPGGKTLKLKSYKLDEVTIGAITVNGWIADDGGPLTIHGNKLDAVLGVGSFQGYVVTMNYAAGRFILEKGTLPLPGVSGVVSFEGPIPSIPVAIGAHTLIADIDTGNDAAALVAPEDVAKAINPNAHWISRGNAHTLAGTVHMFDSPLTDVATAGSTPLVVSRVSYPSPGPVTNIGSRAFEKLVIKLDASNHRVSLTEPSE